MYAQKRAEGYVLYVKRVFNPEIHASVYERKNTFKAKSWKLREETHSLYTVCTLPYPAKLPYPGTCRMCEIWLPTGRKWATEMHTISAQWG